MRLVPVAAMFCAAVLPAAEAPSGGPDAVRIMRKVAWNQGRAQALREAFRYRQSVLVRFHKGKKLVREEAYEFVVRPTPRGSEKERTSFLGRYRYQGKLANYYEPEWEAGDIDIDGALISDMAKDFTSDDRARDGISRDLFPLTLSQIKKYEFSVLGTETYRDREVYRITFVPVNNSWGKHDGIPWKGEVLVDTAKLQPVLVTTSLAKGLPVAVRVLLGTNIKQIGFKVVYEEFEDDLWFPVSYGGEFRIRGLFFYKRNISISLRNSGFERSKVTSKIAYEVPDPGSDENHVDHPGAVNAFDENLLDVGGAARPRDQHH